MDQLFSSLRCAAGISDARNRHIFSSGNTCSVIVFVSCPCPSFSLYFSDTLTHTYIHTIPQGYSTSCCLKKSLFHLISSNRQTRALRAGDWTESNLKKYFHDKKKRRGGNVVAMIQFLKRVFFFDFLNLLYNAEFGCNLVLHRHILLLIHSSADWLRISMRSFYCTDTERHYQDVPKWISPN